MRIQISHWECGSNQSIGQIGTQFILFQTGRIRYSPLSPEAGNDRLEETLSGGGTSHRVNGIIVQPQVSTAKRPVTINHDSVIESVLEKNIIWSLGSVHYLCSGGGGGRSNPQTIPNNFCDPPPKKKIEPLTYLRRYDVRPRNWRTVLWVVGIGKSSTAMTFESFSTPFAETV